MPLIENSSYKAPLISNKHILTIFASKLRKIKNITYNRERILTPDNDFIDLDWSIKKNENLAILCHGLEGSSKSSYIYGMVTLLNNAGWNCVVYNYRGCSGEPNKLAKYYHGGATDDLHTVIKHVVKYKRYKKIILIGFSLGGNLILKYLGENKYKIPQNIKLAVAFSVPCDLKSCVKALMEFNNKIYLSYFLKNFRTKIRWKFNVYPEFYNKENLNKIKNIYDYDEIFTAPLNGYKNANDYWKKCSSKQFIKNIKIPVLLIQSKDDPFLKKDCYPINEAKLNKYFFLEITSKGGHLGFLSEKNLSKYWHEIRTIEFIKEYV